MQARRGTIRRVARDTLSLPQARRIALAASGFGGRALSSALGSSHVANLESGTALATPAPGKRAINDVVRRLGVVQIDSVNVLSRAHYLPVFSRLGAYDRALLDASAGCSPRSLFEYWGHEASLLPVGTHRLLRWRMDRVHDDAWGGMVRIRAEQPELVAQVGAMVANLGPITSTQLEARIAHDSDRNRASWGWNWSGVKRALEYLFWAGEISSAGRDSAFRRQYAATTSVLPASVLNEPTPSPADARRELVAISARAMGVATLADLADYFRLETSATRRAVAELVESGDLLQVAVAGWPTTYLAARARIPREIHADALLVPFDPLIWSRPRVERLFGMRYRIEIYVPAAKREFGYYVLPYLWGERLVARVDLKADREAGLLIVRSAHPQPDMPRAAYPALAQRLREMANWLGLRGVVVEAGPEVLVAELAGSASHWVPERRVPN